MSSNAPKTPLIAPSILSADFMQLGAEVRALDEAGADWIHVDVMDGHFVPNLTFGPGLVKGLRATTKKPLDVHLMVADPAFWVPKFAEAGADGLTIHPEADVHIHRTLELIRSLGKRVGIALNPGTPALPLVEQLLPLLDMVLIMTVNPGFGGQQFLADQLDKIRAVKDLVAKAPHPVLVEVDGGINLETIHSVAKAGADVVVAGHAVMHEGKADAALYAQRMSKLRAAAM